MVSCQNGPTRHAYAWQIGPFWQDTLDMCIPVRPYVDRLLNQVDWTHLLFLLELHIIIIYVNKYFIILTMMKNHALNFLHI